MQQRRSETRGGRRVHQSTTQGWTPLTSEHQSTTQGTTPPVDLCSNQRPKAEHLLSDLINQRPKAGHLLSQRGDTPVHVCGLVSRVRPSSTTSSTAITTNAVTDTLVQHGDACPAR